MSTLRGLAQLADLQGALCVPTINFTKAMQGQKSLPWGEKSTGEEVAQAQGRNVHCLDDAKYDGTPSGRCVWLVGVGKRAPREFRCL